MDVKKICVFLLTISLLTPSAAIAAPIEESTMNSAKPFNPNFILDDYELTNYDSMGVEAIQRFLLGKGGSLGAYRTLDVDGIEREASAIIWRAAQSYAINPKFLIVLLQKEQSLVENPRPLPRDFDWATGYALCDSCSTEDPAIQKFRGFAVQIDRAAARQRYYLEHPSEFGVRVGESHLIDGIMIAPVNQATANLYIYTPHLNGNRNFWNIWNDYFARHYPDGSLLRERDTENIWLLGDGRLRLVASAAALLSDFDTRKVITVSTSDIVRYDIGAPIKFPNYSLLRSPRGTVYLLVNDVRRGIASREIFRGLGFNPEEIIESNWEDLKLYEEGIPITSTDANPLGELLQNNVTGGVYYVAYGVRHPIWSKEILRNRFPRYPISPTSPAILDKYYPGEAVKLKDGELVTAAGQSTVYVISNGQKRPIVSAEAFEELGYQWSNIIVTSPGAMAIHPDGAPIAG